ncbi:MFS transporter [Amycolatopsis sp. NPDC058278]|uniref:MFS transporter n=1 Tax=Amycolatopsis sp. NPDC058278 TaxID=3346417 RepID=UPI0036DB5100
MAESGFFAAVGGLLRERIEPLRPVGYRRIAGAMLVTNVGNGMQFVANVWLVLTMTGSPRAVALVLLTAALPGVFFGPVIGVLIDRFPRRLVFAFADLTSATVLASVVLLQVTGNLATWHVFVMVFLLGLTESTAVPTGTTLVREIVPVDRLLAANATTGVAVQIGNVSGAALGGFILGSSSVSAVLAINVLSYLGSAAFVFGVRTQRVVRTKNENWREAVREAAAGLTYLRTHRPMIPSYLMLLTLFAVLYVLNTLLAPFANDALHVGASGLGYIDAMFAFGAILGGLLLPLATARLNRDRLAALGVIGMGVALVALAYSHALAAPMVLYGLAGVSFQSFYIFRTRVQEHVPVDVQGRVMALLITSVGLCRLVVYAVLAVFVTAGTLRMIYGVVGLLLGLVGVVITIRAFRTDEVSRPPEPEPVTAGPSETEQA